MQIFDFQSESQVKGCVKRNELEKNKEKIFQPLFTSKKHKGIGLGLVLSKQLIELNGGSISFDSF